MTTATATTTTPAAETAGRSTALARVKREGLEIRAKVDALVITDDGTNQIAIETTSIVKRMSKALEAEMKRETDPLNEELKEIRARYKPFMTALDGLETDLKRKMIGYAEEKERKLREEQAARQRVLDELRRKEIEEAKAKGVEAAAPLVLPTTAEAEKTVHADTGSATATKRWTFKAVDKLALIKAIAEGKASPDLVEIVDSVVRGEIRNGVREIPGIQIYQETTMSIR